MKVWRKLLNHLNASGVVRSVITRSIALTIQSATNARSLVIWQQSAEECKAGKIRMFGFGFPRQSFYSFDLPDKTPIDKFNGLVVVQEG